MTDLSVTQKALWCQPTTGKDKDISSSARLRLNNWVEVARLMLKLGDNKGKTGRG